MEPWMGVIVALVVFVAAFWWFKGRQMWKDHKIRVRAKGYVKIARGEVVPHGIEEIWMTLPLMQKVLHERAVFIKDLHVDKVDLENKRADNPYRADDLVEEHVRLEEKIGREMDKFRFAVRIFNQFCEEIGIVLPVGFEDHIAVPTELIPELREELSKSS